MEDAEYKVKTNIFEGPLDLLLQLIEKRKLHINDVSLAQITNDYLTHLEGLRMFPMREAAHFILIASTLVLIKSRSLLPTLELTKEEEGDIRDLERRLKEYKRIKDLSEYVQARFNKNVIFTPSHVSRIMPVFSPTKKITAKTLHDCIKRILNSLPQKDIISQVILAKVVSLEETMAALTDRIKKDLNLRFKDFANAEKKDRINIVMSFLAVLELVRRGIVSVKQDEHFEDIFIKKT